MAVEVETQGQLQEFWSVLRRRRWQVLLPAVVVLSLGVFVAVIVPKKFVAKTEVELRPVGVSISAKEASNAPFQIKSKARLKQVVQELQYSEYLSLTQEQQSEWLDDAQRSIKVTIAQTTQTGTSFVTIEYADVQREWAAEFLRALRDDWTEDVVESDRRKAQDELARLRDNKSRLEKQYQREEEQLTEQRRLHNLSATQPVPGADATRSEDPVFERLKRNEAELDQVGAEISTLEVKIAALAERLLDMPQRIEREVTVGGGVSNEAELAAIEREILDLNAQLEGIRPQHSEYRKTTEKIRALEEKREQLARIVTKGELQKSTAPNPEIEPLRRRVEELRTELRVAEATRDRLKAEIEADQARTDELQYVYRDVRERAERIARLKAELSDAESAYQKKSREVEMLLSPLSDPFVITQEVDTPTKPTEPNPLLIVSFALVFGLGLGLSLAILLEFSKSSFRSVAEVGRVMAVPVLGAIAPIVTRGEARRASARRVVVAASSLVFVGAVLFVTWAWANDAKYLSQDVRDAIEGLRARLK